MVTATKDPLFSMDAKYYQDQAPYRQKVKLHGKDKPATPISATYTRGGIELMLRGLWTMIFVSKTYADLRHTIKTIEANPHIHDVLKAELVKEAREKYPYCDRKGSVNHDSLEQAYFMGNDARF